MSEGAGVASLLVDVRPIDHPTAAQRGIGRYTAGLLRGLCRVGAPVVGLAGSAAEAERAHAAVPELTVRPWGPGALREHGGGSSWYLATQLLLHPVPLDPIPSAVTAAGLPVAAVMYDVIPYRHPELYLRDPNARALAEVRALLARTVDAMLAISRFSADTAAQELGYPRERIEVVGAGVDAPFVRPEVRRPPWPDRIMAADPGPYVVAVTGADERKNTEGLLRAWGQVAPAARRGARLVIATSAPDPVLRRWAAVAADAGVADQVLLTGRVTDDEMVALLQSARLAVLPSIDEGFGLPVLEAAACGCPAICSGTTSLPEVLDEPAAWFDPADTSSMARALELGLVDDGRRELLLAAAARAVERYTWERVATDTMDALAALGPRWQRAPRTPRRRLAVAGAISGETGGPPALVDDLVEALRRLPAAPFVDLLVDHGGRPEPTAAGPGRFPVRALGRYLKPWDYDDIVAVVADGRERAVSAVAGRVPCHVWMAADAPHGDGSSASHPPALRAALAIARSIIVPSEEAAAGVRAASPDGPPLLVLPLPEPPLAAGPDPSPADTAPAAFDELAAELTRWLGDVERLERGTIRRLPARPG